MQEQWNAAQACIQVHLEEDNDYITFLKSIEQKLARKLRFERCLRHGNLVESIVFDRFVQSAAQLRHLHVVFQGKLKPIAEPLASEMLRLIDTKCSNLVEIVADMLCAIRFLYGQLFAQSEVIRVTLETALAHEDKEWDGNILEKYLETEHLTVDNLVSRPLKRFTEVIEFVEALSTKLSEDGGPNSGSNDCDKVSDERLEYAIQLMHIVQENKQYINFAKADAREENELIALQTCFYGDGADVLNDLSNNKLLLHGEVFLMLLKDSSNFSRVSPEVAINAGLFSDLEKVYAHCFQDGTLVCSKRQNTELGVSFVILHRLQLKQDAAFLEFVPASISLLEASKEARALALIYRDKTFVFAWKGVVESQRWADTIERFLEMNELRTEVFHQSRTIDELPICKEISAQLVENDTAPTKFASFYDDHLPGVFWMAPCKGSNPAQWELVEIVFYARWLLVFKIEGWKKHSVLYNFDTHSPKMEITEHPRAESEWSLVISIGSVDFATLVSMKRTRIDFWFDQVWKAVESAQVAARRAEEEKIKCLATEKKGVRMQRDSRMKAEKIAGKKRSIEESFDNNKVLIATANEKEQSTSTLSPAGCYKLGHDTDEECFELDRGLMMISAEEKQTAAPSAKRLRRVPDKSKYIPHMVCTEKNDIIAAVTLAAVKTHKQKRLKRKSNDIAPIPTQPSPSIPTDESTSDIDITQLSANEEPAEHEPKPKQVRIILTGIELTALIRKKIGLIAGAVYEDDIKEATHIIAPKGQLKRTVKLLCGISTCVHVLDVRWLEESARVGSPISERAYCLKDTRAEKKWQFDLRKTMYDFTPKQRQQLFSGHQVFITSHKSVLPPIKDLVKIVECAGGTAVTKGSAGPDNVVITSEAAMATASVRKALTLANPQRVYSTELILSSILQQHLDLDKNRLERTSGECRRRK
ncbi:unnamed protein product [Peronospora belbahrii]|uniref:BRCT domain-containing protein n=1 Tax=Peronospora belbahrii TaxID=622444 RepID=A0ABN8D3H0_9STRA|nr:unnamed protein product [Peronospora belbahrii]